MASGGRWRIHDRRCFANPSLGGMPKRSAGMERASLAGPLSAGGTALRAVFWPASAVRRERTQGRGSPARGRGACSRAARSPIGSRLNMAALSRRAGTAAKHRKPGGSEPSLSVFLSASVPELTSPLSRSDRYLLRRRSVPPPRAACRSGCEADSRVWRSRLHEARKIAAARSAALLLSFSFEVNGAALGGAAPARYSVNSH